MKKNIQILQFLSSSLAFYANAKTYFIIELEAKQNTIFFLSMKTIEVSLNKYYKFEFGKPLTGLRHLLKDLNSSSLAFTNKIFLPDHNQYHYCNFIHDLKNKSQN